MMLIKDVMQQLSEPNDKVLDACPDKCFRGCASF